VVAVEVGVHPFAQVFGFPHVYDGVFLIEVVVHSRLFGKGFQYGFEWSGRVHVAKVRSEHGSADA
jgi:hypothetical protein